MNKVYLVVDGAVVETRRVDLRGKQEQTTRPFGRLYYHRLLPDQPQMHTFN
jgi:hypothetical protein